MSVLYPEMISQIQNCLKVQYDTITGEIKGYTLSKFQFHCVFLSDYVKETTSHVNLNIGPPTYDV